MSWQEIAWLAAEVSSGIILLLLFFPLLYLIYRLLCIAFSRDAKRADNIYRAALYRFHMAGFERDAKTPLEYALTTVDPSLLAGFEEFMRMYLRLKYSSEKLRAEDREVIRRFSGQIGNAIRRKIGFAQAIINYLNVLRAIRYFQQPESTDQETLSL